MQYGSDITVCWGWMLVVKRFDSIIFKFKKLSIKQAILITEILSIYIKVHTHTKKLNFLLTRENFWVYLYIHICFFSHVDKDLMITKYFVHFSRPSQKLLVVCLKVDLIAMQKSYWILSSCGQVWMLTCVQNIFIIRAVLGSCNKPC